MALELKELQDDLFVAQVNLAGARSYNLYLARRLQETEKRVQAKGGKSQ
jgi:hypothetical protein